MSDSDISPVQRLIRLKRYERPSEGYFDDFLLEFQHRQRMEVLRRSAFRMWLERVSSWFSNFGRRKWVYAGGVAYAAIMISAYLASDPVDGSRADSSVDAGAPPAAGVEPLPLSPSSPGGQPRVTEDSRQPAREGRVQPVNSPTYREL